MQSAASSTHPLPSTLLPQFQADLKRFATSPSSFQVVDAVSAVPPPTCSPKTVHVLDSSFNPPTQAHLRIALSALHSNAPKPQRLLLLLATQNADKAPKPAAFEHRIAMMRLLAQDIQDQYITSGNPRGVVEDDVLTVDVGITKKPYFHDKAIGIEESGFYTDPHTGNQPQQVHLLGFDSLIRLLDTKYYAPDHTLAPVDALLGKHRIRVTRRTEEGNKWGTEEEQNRPREELAKGEREAEGGRKEWAQSIDMVAGEGEAISSTRVRESANAGKWDNVDRLVGRRVREWVEEYQLYKESVAKG
ncbi:MAG: hypothetical protein LQ344_001715 [Seirophora lacunosa]|nr:MAG: hypothetical protein LQ344_001715 [Seirophora lacunosa]